MQRKQAYHLTPFERGQIDYLWNTEGIHNQAEIARRLHRTVMTINNELRRSQRFSDYKLRPRKWHAYRYNAEEAQQYADLRKDRIGTKKKYSKKKARIIAKRILDDKWSPQMIAETHKELKLSRNTIYNWIYRGMIPGVSESNLRYRHKYRRVRPQRTVEMNAKEKRAAELKTERKRVKQKEKQLVRPLKHSIEERPVGVDKRKVFGHWEVDCVLPKKGYKQVFVTFCERKTRYYIVLKAESQSGKAVCKVLDQFMGLLGRRAKHIVQSFTFDNGFEFANHFVINKVQREYELMAYFAHPYSPAERGSNENANRMLREYFPKKTHFEYVNNDDIRRVLHKINKRPKAVLNYKTPRDVFRQKMHEIDRTFGYKRHLRRSKNTKKR
ncbi:IS30 family transposase [Liquorilactobacillus satsumensis]|uniref:IS30 family transposase n=1 Tax=Liquorilactobacillus satsumensis TaxID=259059 RepID=UPI0021C45CD1|nr:IS30 family transposase [Liquorilactobacillus satsumensis]MCP9356704.1 IS30 family transposase [Liquorilactobacillus satsumensis]MCP9370644.1 IS30 family transposase [Liquorilactobacillus satsumensis]